tara:strand:+ start:1712 stop:2107 length:396 start_codon:yes stop_codon:yes gene_type:complete
MKLELAFKYLNLAYAFGLICFLFLFYFKIKIIFLTNFITILSIILLITKLGHWFNIRKINKNIDKKKSFLYRLSICILAYITPVYCIIQNPNLVISHHITAITLTIVVILAIIGLVMERKLSFKELKYLSN